MSAPADEKKPFDQVGFIMAYEAGELSGSEVIEGFQHLIDSGVVWQLQGAYGRQAMALIEAGHCTRPAPSPSNVMGGRLADVGPFTKVSRDEIRRYPNGRSLRLVLYGAYNACGLIGSENNGIAVLDEDEREVVCDGLGRESTGYFGPSAAQNRLFDKLLAMDWEAICERVNAAPRRRRPLSA